MAQISIIKKSELEGATRLDAEYYQPKYLAAAKALASHPKLKQFLRHSIIHPTEIKRVYTDEGYPFALSQNISDNLLDFSQQVFIPEETAKLVPKNKIDIGDILMIRTGQVGKAAPYLGAPPNLFASAHVLVIKIRDIPSCYLSTYLNSKFGRTLLERGTYGALQPELAPSYVETVPVPRLGDTAEHEIENMVLEAHNVKKQSESFYLQAEQLLLDELGFKDLDLSHQLHYIVPYRKAREAGRLDAEHFQPKYDKLILKIKMQNAKLLGDIVSIKKGIEPGSEEYQEEGKLFIRVSSLSKNGIEDRDQKYLDEELHQKLRTNHQPKVGEILLTKDATPGIAYVVKELIEGIISSGILRLKLKDKEIENEYLALCLNSVIGQMQAERDGGGSVISHWKPEQIKNVLIPILPKPTQQKIADLVQSSHEARQKARQLLEEAKRKVEEMVGKGNLSEY